MALHENGQCPSNDHPEREYVDEMKLYSRGLFIKRTIIAFGIVSVGYLLLSKKPMIKKLLKNNV